MVEAFTGEQVVDLIVAPWAEAITASVIAVLVIALAFVVGFYVSKYIAQIIEMALQKAKVEKWIDDNSLGTALLGFRLTQIIVVWVKVYIIAAAIGTGFALVSSDLPIVATINGFIEYMGTLASSLVIIVGALFIAKYISNEIKKGDVLFSTQIAGAIHLAIAYFVAVSTLPNLLPGPGEVIADLLTFFLQALVVGIGLAIGLAFGLGLKDVISKSAAKNQAAIEKYIVNLGKK